MPQVGIDQNFAARAQQVLDQAPAPRAILGPHLKVLRAGGAAGRYAELRMRMGKAEIDDLESEISGIDNRLFATRQALEKTGLDKDAERFRDNNEATLERIAERAAELRDHLAILNERRAEKAALLAKLYQRDQGCTRVLAEAVAGTPIRFLGEPERPEKNADVDKARNSVVAIKQARESVQNASRPRAVIEQNISAWIASRASVPDISRMALRGEFSMNEPYLPSWGDDVDVLGLVLHLVGDKLKDTLFARVAELDLELALDDKAQITRLADLTKKLREAEGLEEAIVYHENLEPRADADPCAILNCVLR